MLASDGHAPMVMVPHYPYWEWSVRTTLDMQEGGTGDSLAVYLFLGDPPENPREWMSAPNCVGFQGRYGSYPRIMVGCDDITFDIERLSGLGSFHPDVVVPYLKEELQWRVETVNHVPIDLKFLEVVVFAEYMNWSPEENFPIAEECRQYNSITYGNPGGSHDPQDKTCRTENVF